MSYRLIESTFGILSPFQMLVLYSA